MAIWRPKSDEPVGNNEHIGRRLFDEPMLAGVQSQQNFQGLQLRHFEEKRDNELSLDRLGRSGIDRKVTSYLVPRGHAQGQTFQPEKPFHGWAVIRAAVLAKPPNGHSFPVIASPILEPDLAENMYHAHVVLPAELSPLFVAYHLKHLFTTQGKVEPVDRPEPQTPASLKSMAISWVRRFQAEWDALFRR